MGRRWQKFMAWQDTFYSSTVLVAEGNSWMATSPLAAVQTVADMVIPGRKKTIGDDETAKLEEVTGVEAKMMDSNFEQVVLDVNRDIQVIIRNFNPGVPLSSLSWDELAEYILDNPTIRGRIMSKWEAYNMCAEALNDEEVAYLQEMNP